MLSARRVLQAVTLFGLTLCSGCATVDIPWLEQMPHASRRNPVMQIVCMWEPSEGRDPQGVPCRGFAGQILFLGNRGGTPVSVEGDVSVFVFDDIGTEEEQAAPVHQFNFDALSWNRHLKSGSLGPSYHCFIPYTRPGNMEAVCTVRLKYMPKNAPEVLSDPSHITMRGKKRNGSASVEDGSSLVSVLTRPQPSVGPRTTTISLQDQRSPMRDQAVARGAAVDPVKQILEDYKAEKALQQPKIVEPLASRRMRLGTSAVQTVHYEESPGDQETIAPATYNTEGDDRDWHVE
ncbi:hypothetical protein GC163_07125 [bacterium]|nr:hypothetical protein [bacterium]